MLIIHSGLKVVLLFTYLCILVISELFHPVLFFINSHQSLPLLNWSPFLTFRPWEKAFMCFFCSCFCEQACRHPWRLKEGTWTPGAGKAGVCVCVWLLMWALGTELRFSATAVSGFYHWTIILPFFKTLINLHISDINFM